MFVWVLTFFLISNDSRAGNSALTVDNIVSYQDCMTLGNQMENLYRKGDRYTLLEYGCMKVKKIK